VALVEIPANILYHQADEKTQFPGAKVYGVDDLRAQGNSKAVEQAVDLLTSAERPLLVGGDGVFWSGAANELRELAELTQTPAYCRRAGQGALPEDHPLSIRGAWKKPFIADADVIVTVGFRFWSGEKFGQPPTWNAKAMYVQIDATPSRLGGHVAADVPIVGDPKLVLRQMNDLAKGNRATFDRKRNSAWLKKVADARAQFEQAIREREAKIHNDIPIHPDRLTRELVDVLDPSSSVVIDSFTLSGYMSHWFLSRFPGQVVDAGPLAPVGHGIGMAIGVQLARPGKPVVTVIGDGGIGIGGFDMETAARYKLPIVAVLWNNSSWGPSFEQMPMLKGRTDAFDMLPNIRYDRLFTELGCHGEHVERPDEIRPALERALGSGKPAVVNVIGDKRIGHPGLGGNLLGSTQV
jgi:acetolactate synthase-1/2/3 large subunit